MRWMKLQEIKETLNIERAMALQEEGFKLYSSGKVTAPPVGYMGFGQEVGEVHVKYGWIEGDESFVVKIAGNFCQNLVKHGLASCQGIFLVFNARTGQPKAILQDEGYLTNIRTAMAGCIAAKYLAPKKIKAIGILGTGLQARLQAELLRGQTDCRDLWVWGRDVGKVGSYSQDMKVLGFQVFVAASPSEVAKNCNLIVTTTSSKNPLLKAGDIQPGTHITAVGADAPGKQELDPESVRLSDLCVVDSKSQCIDHGEIAHAYKARMIAEEGLVELGEVIFDPRRGRQSEEQITLADLTGVSVQDIQIAKSVLGAR